MALGLAACLLSVTKNTNRAASASPDYATVLNGLDEAVRTRILGYRPRVPDAQWSRISSFVLSTALSAQPATEKKAREMMLALTRLASWADSSAGLPLTPKALLRPAVIHRFAAGQEDSLNTRLAHSRLLQVLEARGGDRTSRPTLTSASTKEPRPYGARELVEFSTAIQAIPDVEHRRNALAIMGFAGGAGLRREELMLLSAQDVLEHDDTYVVSVPGAHSRRVAVRRDWAPYVRRGLKGLTAEALIFFPGPSDMSSRHRRYNRFRRMHAGSLPTMEGLRVTWLADMVNALPLGTFMHVAGYSRVNSVSLFEPLLETLPDGELLPLLSRAS